MPTRRLPEKPDLDHLKAQARALLAAASRGDARACQRVREFHPRFADATDEDIANGNMTWSDGLFLMAREYGYASWPRLKARIGSDGPADAPAAFTDRIEDPILRQAVQAVDDGDMTTLRALLDACPDLVSRRARFEGENYFRAPALLAFVAENPVRNDSLPPNIVAITRLLLERGAASNRADVQETLHLVASGRVAREAGAQPALLALLVAFGAAPDTAMDAALTHGEFAAAQTLLRLGAPLSLPVAAALGDMPHASRLLPGASAGERRLALALAAQHGRADILRLLLEAGEDPNRYNPPGSHAHSTPLDQAALNGHEDALAALIEHGARTDLRDTLWNGTALDWARHGGQEAIAALLAAKHG